MQSQDDLNQFDPDLFQDNKTPNGKMFLVGYRKFIVAVLWVVLMYIVVLVSIFGKPSAGQITMALWVISGCGFFTAFFAGGNVLAKMWQAKYAPPQTMSVLNHQTKEEKKEVEIVYKYNPQEDSSFSKVFEGEENNLPKAKKRES